MKVRSNITTNKKEKNDIFSENLNLISGHSKFWSKNEIYNFILSMFNFQVPNKLKPSLSLKHTKMFMLINHWKKSVLLYIQWIKKSKCMVSELV